MVELNAIKVAYGQKEILSIPSLSLEKGKWYGLIGENGSGKTTLIRLLAKTLNPTTGNVNGLEQLNIGYLPQNPYMFSFSVLENVKMGTGNRKAGADEAAERMIEAVGLEGFKSSRGDKLSGGEGQRMALARVLAVQHDLLLLDEPTSATDIRGMIRVERLLQEYQAGTGCTVVFATHSPAQAGRLADEIIYLEAGKIIEEGPAHSLLTSPQDSRTADFLNHWSIKS